jgi:hypothetical protein
MIRGGRHLVWPLLGVLTVCTAGCTVTTDSQQVALSRATDSARGLALATLTRLQAVRDPSAVGAALQDLVANPKPATATILLGTTSGSAGHFAADLSFFAAGDAGSGDGMAQVVVRLCAHYAGTIGTHGQVTVTDLTCPALVPTKEFGFPASTVTLND